MGWEGRFRWPGHRHAGPTREKSSNSQGIGGLIEELGARLRHRLGDPTEKVPYHEFRTADWDLRRGVRTEGNVAPETFDAALPNREHAQAYIPTTIWAFRRAMAAMIRAGARRASPPWWTTVAARGGPS